MIPSYRSQSALNIAGSSREQETVEHASRHTAKMSPGPLAGGHGKRHTIVPSVFAAMPFDPTFDDVYFFAMRHAAELIGAECVRVDYLLHGGDAVDVTRREIERAAAVVADVTDAEPDVLYELGYAHALGKPAIQLSSSPIDKLPFVVRNRETILYTRGRTHLLAPFLARYLEKLIGA